MPPRAAPARPVSLQAVGVAVATEGQASWEWGAQNRAEQWSKGSLGPHRDQATPAARWPCTSEDLASGPAASPPLYPERANSDFDSSKGAPV